MTEHLRLYGAHQRSDLTMLLSVVRPGDRVVDVGAHIGTFAIPIGRKVGPAGKVYAFEPVKAHFEVLRQNVARNDLDGVVVPVNVLVTCSHAQLRLDYARDQTGKARFSEGGMIDLPTDRIQLDEWWRSLPDRPQVAVVKVDVEGMERAPRCHAGGEGVPAGRPGEKGECPVPGHSTEEAGTSSFVAAARSQQTTARPVSFEEAGQLRARSGFEELHCPCHQAVAPAVDDRQPWAARPAGHTGSRQDQPRRQLGSRPSQSASRSS